MFRTALLRSARSAATKAVQRPAAIGRPIAPSSFVTKSQFAPSAFQAARCYSAAAGLDKAEVEGRILSLLTNFDKVSALDEPFAGRPGHCRGCYGYRGGLYKRITTEDWRLMRLQEFSIEIPDKDADSILSVDQAVEYILHQPDG
ncbi:mitochondrial acyl carrier protein [Ciborinia camelliae]|nr:mitochondrial acyl carrier protein [Ciborinia camelliae]